MRRVERHQDGDAARSRARGCGTTPLPWRSGGQTCRERLNCGRRSRRETSSACRRTRPCRLAVATTMPGRPARLPPPPAAIRGRVRPRPKEYPSEGRGRARRCSRPRVSTPASGGPRCSSRRTRYATGTRGCRRYTCDARHDAGETTAHLDSWSDRRFPAAVHERARRAGCTMRSRDRARSRPRRYISAFSALCLGCGRSAYGDGGSMGFDESATLEREPEDEALPPIPTPRASSSPRWARTAASRGLVADGPREGRAIVDRVDRLATSELPVLFTGEEGVGKRSPRCLAPHAQSRRARAPFVRVSWSSGVRGAARGWSCSGSRSGTRRARAGGARGRRRRDDPDRARRTRSPSSFEPRLIHVIEYAQVYHRPCSASPPRRARVRVPRDRAETLRRSRSRPPPRGRGRRRSAPRARPADIEPLARRLLAAATFHARSDGGRSTSPPTRWRRFAGLRLARQRRRAPDRDRMRAALRAMSGRIEARDLRSPPSDGRGDRSAPSTTTSSASNATGSRARSPRAAERTEADARRGRSSGSRGTRCWRGSRRTGCRATGVTTREPDHA